MADNPQSSSSQDDAFAWRLWRYEGEPGELIPLLQSAQDHFGYIPRRAIRHIASVTGVPESTVYGVITFYSQFRLKPMGEHVIRACTGTACHVAGSKELVTTLVDELGVEVGDTTDDGQHTLFTVACIGCCSLAPVVMVDAKTHGRLTPAAVRKLLRKLRRESEGRKASSDPA